MKMRLPRHTPVVLVAAACLLLGSTGGAVAGAMITGKQIKDNTVTTKDIKNGTLAVKDLSTKARTKLAGVSGPAGAVGPAGAAGPRGFSAWDTVPSGTVLTGRFFDAGMTGTTAAERYENINFPAKLPGAPTSLGFGPDTYAQSDDDPTCTGSFVQPTAPPGKVCVYLGYLDNFDDVAVSTWDDPQHRPYAFYLELDEQTADDAYNYYGSWAYTAP